MREEDMAVVKSLVSVAWADGDFHEKEREMVEALINAFEANEDESKQIREYAAEKKTLDDVPVLDLGPGDRRVLVQHAVLLTFVDGQQHEVEKKFVSDLCRTLAISDEESHALVSAAEARAKRFLNLL
jgi:tellurite resistance protein